MDERTEEILQDNSGYHRLKGELKDLEALEEYLKASEADKVREDDAGEPQFVEWQEDPHGI